MFNCSFLLILSWHSHICLYNPEDFISSAHCFLPLVTTLNLSYLTFISWSLLQSIQWLFPRSNPNQVELWKLGYSLIPHVSGSEFGTGLLPSPDQGHTASVKHSVQLLSCVWLFAATRTAVIQASLSNTNSRCLLKLMSIEWVMPSNHLILLSPPLSAFTLSQH